jgi:hypothetical protein
MLMIGGLNEAFNKACDPGRTLLMIQPQLAAGVVQW